MNKQDITGKTQICGVIGDPIAHTMSPAIHNAAFSELGLNYVYLPFHVEPDSLEVAIKGMRALNIKGLNVTIPHKVSVIPFLDELDDLTQKIGAVNTIVNSNGKLKGYNTDATGFLQTLADNNIDIKGKRLVVLGAGGASRAISMSLAEKGASITILNRLLELDWALELASHISNLFEIEVKALELTGNNLRNALAEADILVNTTSVGMHPYTASSPVDADLLRPDLVVFDAVYNPVKTRLLADAEAAGARTISGIDMLVWQGAHAFEKWTGQKAPVEVMKQQLEYLTGNKQEHEN